MTPMTADSATRHRLLLRLLLGAILVGALAALVVPAGLGWDFANFYDTGRRVAAGQLQDIYNPTSLIAGVDPQGKMAFWGAPISAWFYVPLSFLPPSVALFTFKLIAVLATAAALVLLYRLTRRWVEDSPGRQVRYALVFATLVLIFQPFWTIYRVGGQTTPLVLLLLVLGMTSYVKENYLATAIWMVLAVLIKPAFIIVPGFLALVSGRRYLVNLVAVGAVVGLASIALLGWPIHREFLEILRRGSDKPSPWPFNSSLYIIADAFRPIADSIPIRRTGGWFPDLMRILLKLLVVASVVMVMVQSYRHSFSEIRRRLFNFLMAISFTLLISQVVWEHYLAVLFVPLIFLVASWPRLDRAARRHLAAIFALCILQNLILVSYFRGHVPIHSNLALLGVSLLKAGPLVAFLAFIWFRRELLFRILSEPGVPDPVFASSPVLPAEPHPPKAPRTLRTAEKQRLT